MKIEHLQKIIDRIQNQIHCPKCKARFLREDIEINSVKGNQVEFSSACKACDARAQISAEIGASVEGPVVPKIKKAPVDYFQEVKASLKPEDLKSIKDSVDKFKSRDVSDLFS